MCVRQMRPPPVGGTFRSFNKDFLLALATDFKQHGASAIAKVRKQQPAASMKICALLVPREMKVEHSGRVKAMTDEQLEAAIEAIQAMLAGRAGDDARIVEGVSEPAVLPAPSPRKTRRKVRKSDVSVGSSVSKDEEEANS